MKKIFAIISVLTLSLVASAGHYNYNPTEVTSFKIEDISYGSSYCYMISIGQSGYNTSDKTSYTTSAEIYIYPETHSFVGEFVLEDGSLDPYSFIKSGSNTRYFIEGDTYWTSNNATKITITDEGNGKYIFGGVVICENSAQTNSYRYVYEDYQFSMGEPDPYEAEPSEKMNITWSSDALEVYSASGVAPVEMYAFKSDWSDIDLLFNVDSYDIPEGDYVISGSGEKGTVQAADGKEVSYMPNPSYFHNAMYDIYYLVSGTLTVSYSKGNMIITGTATTGHGSTIEISLTGPDPFGHEIVDPVIYQANEDGMTATVIGIDPTFTGEDVVVASSVKIGTKEYTVTSIADQAFTRQTGLKSIVLPATLWTIGKAAFSFCTGLESIECQGVLVPEVGATAFYKVNPGITVFVPYGLIDNYKNADGWKMFTVFSEK